MSNQSESELEAKARRLAELDRISALQSELNQDLTEADAEALVQRYLAEDRAERRKPKPAADNDDTARMDSLTPS